MEIIMSIITEITDFNAPELDVYARLSEAQLLNHEFPDKGMFRDFCNMGRGNPPPF